MGITKGFKFSEEVIKKRKTLFKKGKLNPKWRGGVCYYPDYGELKRNRLIILMQNPKCEICKKQTKHIHHKDKSRNNHTLNNLMAVCPKCHTNLHSKFYQQYGLSLSEMSNKYKLSIPAIIYRLKNKLSLSFPKYGSRKSMKIRLEEYMHKKAEWKKQINQISMDESRQLTTKNS